MARDKGVSRRDEVMRVLGESPVPIPVVSIAERLGLHPNTVRFHLDRLVTDGRVEKTTSDRGIPGRPAQLFRSARAADVGTTGQYRMLAEVLVDQLAHTSDPTVSAREAGSAWGRRQAEAAGIGDVDDPLDALTHMMKQIGFSPEHTAADQITARRCPFLDLACRDPDVVCSIHLGLLQGALDGWDADVTVTDIDRRRMQETCIAHLAPRPVSPDRTRTE